ncbi:hypothetical protein HYH03_009759 [Edaphochlamys debaryana]|uniref:Endonuclease V n=1 Tax=Edaphochlamys debaryana TaxID=47281 RepID=A0A835XY33_9CHLO|nr:hypothetical protein HYH03_009759 [Edaphochlamys debaryana]|eukprot:KAG2492030.1 hypothetical protein HYH03_009759 [Edaphochlamys debaryana]
MQSARCERYGHPELIAEWTRLQQEMASRVVREDDVPWRLDAEEPGVRLERVGGLDLSFAEEAPAAGPANEGHDPEGSGVTAGSGEALPLGPGVAALVVLSFPDLRVLYEDYEPVDLSIPYLPGFLGFREAAAYAALLRRAEASPHRPQVLLVDGCGVLHPRACGSACQVGVTCGYPCVGVAKNLLAVDGLDRFEVRAQLQAEAEKAQAQAQAQGAATQVGAASTEASGAALAAPGAGAHVGVADPQPQQASEPGPGPGSGPAPGSGPGSEPKPGPEPQACGTSSLQASEPQHTEAGEGHCQGTHGDGGRGRAGGGKAGRGGAGGGGARVPTDVCVPLTGASGAVHGMALCPGATRKPLFISVGHRLSLATALELVRRCCLHRIPEPIRQADLRSRQWMRERAGAGSAGAESAGAGQAGGGQMGAGQAEAPAFAGASGRAREPGPIVCTRRPPFRQQPPRPPLTPAMAAAAAAEPAQLPDWVKPAFLEFKRLELEWLDGLSAERKLKLAGRGGRFSTEKNHIRSYGESASRWLASSPARCWPAYGLEEKGFVLQEITHALKTDNPIHPGFKEQIGRALGYPLPQGEGTISYIDATEADEANTCCVPVVEYFTDLSPASLQPIMQHFVRYNALYEQYLGRRLTIDTARHPLLSRHLRQMKAGR